MRFSKYSILVLLEEAFVDAVWVFGRSAFKGLTYWLLWALAALCACAGVVVLLEAEGRSQVFLSVFVLWAFSAYLIKVAKSLRKRR